MSRYSHFEIAGAMSSLVMAGESCNTCNQERYGNCPYEDTPWAKHSHEIPVINGKKICHKHSNAWKFLS